MEIFFVALFGALGTIARYGVSKLAWTGAFPWAVFFVNVLGSWLIGCLGGLGLNPQTPLPVWRVAAVVGFLGGFTTFSSFSWDVVRLISTERVGLAVFYAVLSPAACIALAGFGWWCSRLWLKV
ncbi:CrcB family protein [bacterium]|nr:CrcB family protein [bacterium]